MSAFLLPQARAPAPSAREETELLAAFGRFLRIDVANGDATPDTLATYRREVATWVAWCAAEEVDPATATRADVEAYREALKEAGAAVATRRRKLSIVRRFYDAAVQHGLLLVNPAEGVKAGHDPTAPEDRIHFLPEAHLAALVNAIPADTLTGQRDRALVGLMALHGLRRVEVHRLDHKSLHDGDDPYLGVNGKGRKQRRVYLRADTAAALRAYAEAKAAAGLPPAGAFFVAHSNHGRGQRLSRAALNEVVNGYLEAAALKQPGMSCHALRHTAATLAVAGGAQIEQVQAMLGHAQLETTGIYVKAVERVRHNPAYCIGVTLDLT